MFARLLIMVGAVFAAMPVFAQSPVGHMEGFYEKSKNSFVSTTEPGVYESQSRYALTGGSFVWRAEQENATLLNYDLPSITAGCGGIDIFAGSFSFINGDQLETLLRAIIQDAAGYAFSLAISEISPQIGSKLESMMDIVKDINGQNVNSCEAATSLVKNAQSVYNASRKNNCKIAGTAAGIFQDALSGRICGHQKPADVKSAAIDAGVEVTGPENSNLAMQASDKMSSVDDLTLREFFMSITGTLLIQDGDELVYNYIPPIAIDESVAGAIMRGGTIHGHRCKAITLGTTNYTAEDCLDVVQFDKDIVINPSDGYLIRVQNILGTIYDKSTGVLTSPFTPEEISFVESTPIPVLEAANILSQRHPETGRQMLLSYADLAAYEMALSYLENVSRLILNAAQQNPGANKDDLDAWRKGVRDNVATLGEMQSRLNLRYANIQDTIKSLNEMQGAVNARVNANLLRTATSNRTGR